LPAFTSSAQSRPDERTSFTYDALDRLVTETDRLGNVTHYTHDLSKGLSTVSDRVGQTWT